MPELKRPLKPGSAPVKKATRVRFGVKTAKPYSSIPKTTRKDYGGGEIKSTSELRRKAKTFGRKTARPQAPRPKPKKPKKPKTKKSTPKQATTTTKITITTPTPPGSAEGKAEGQTALGNIWGKLQQYLGEYADRFLTPEPTPTAVPTPEPTPTAVPTPRPMPPGPLRDVY